MAAIERRKIIQLFSSMLKAKQTKRRWNHLKYDVGSSRHFQQSQKKLFFFSLKFTYSKAFDMVSDNLKTFTLKNIEGNVNHLASVALLVNICVHAETKAMFTATG